MRISFQGDCTVARAAEFRTTLLEALAAGTDIEIDLAEVKAIDLTFCQVLHALRQSCAAKGVKCVLPDIIPPELVEQARLCGFSEIAGLSVQDACQESEAAP